jgi:transcriptional regulator with XRE-family HTH domain
MTLKMSQTALGDALGVTFQQVQKYEKGVNRIGAGRLQAIAGVLQVPISHFFEGAPTVTRAVRSKEAAPDYVSRFLTMTESVALIKAFVQIKQPQLRRRFVVLAREIADADD